MTLTVPLSPVAPLSPKHFDSTYSLSGIYAICRAGKCVYIGISGNIWSRWGQHRTALRSGTHCSAGLRSIYRREDEALWEFVVLKEMRHTTSPTLEKALIHLLDPIGNSAYYDKNRRDYETYYVEAQEIAARHRLLTPAPAQQIADALGIVVNVQMRYADGKVEE